MGTSVSILRASMLNVLIEYALHTWVGTNNEKNLRIAVKRNIPLNRECYTCDVYVDIFVNKEITKGIFVCKSILPYGTYLP